MFNIETFVFIKPAWRSEKKRMRDYYLDERVSVSSALILKYCRKFLSPAPKIKLVDLGCGDGRALEKMINILKSNDLKIEKVFAVDINPSVKGSELVEIIRSDLNYPKLSISDSSIHIVFSLETIEHLINPYAFVKEVHRILLGNGILLLTTPNILAWYNRILFLFGSLPIHYEVTEEKSYGRLVARNGPTVGHIKVFSPKALNELLKDNGFCVEKMEGLRFLYGRKIAFIDSFFSHYPSLSSSFCTISRKVKLTK
jgi:2-polyprenyl-3-methyl-5-hydroxy-6-metoxy-1,4-benzoquinol methylase